MKKLIFSIVCLLILAQFGISQTFNKAKLDSFFAEIEKHNKFMGSVAISKGGKIIYTKTIGFVDVENKIRATDSSKYRIGSISKTFTAVLTFKAIEKKILNINQSIDKWFPTIPNSKKITIEHLLSHQSGIHNFTNDNNYLTYHTLRQTEKDMIKRIEKGGSDFEPGSKTQYSNSNYVLLSYILEKVYNKSYAELLQEYIVKPLGLKNTYISEHINVKNNECKSYKYVGYWVEEAQTHYTVALGAGAITSTSSDLIKFSDALFGGKILTTKSINIMKTLKNGYGMGIFPVPFYKSIGYGHTGSIDGFNSVFTHFPDEKISYALVSNGSNYNINDISIAVLSAVYNKPYEIPTFTNYNITSEDLDVYLGVYTSEQITLKITITKNENTLIVQGTGQPAIPFDPIAKNKFKSDMVGAKIEFNPSNKTMILFQGGGQITFKKEE